jgi:hypothetical protein
MLPGSDPVVFRTYRWALGHSPSLRQLVRQLATAERKARYRLVPGLEPNYGRLVVLATEKEYEIDIQVPILGWNRCGDALEPWIASALYLALETASKGKLKETDNPHHLHFREGTMQAAFDFQAQVRRELVAADPVRLKDLPDGARLYRLGFRPLPVAPGASRVPNRRPLPDDL